MQPDKFTIPFVNDILSKNEFKNHDFLFLSDFEKADFKNNGRINIFKNRIRNNFIYKARKFFDLSRKANLIVLHSFTAYPFFIIFPSFLKKTAWIILGEDLYTYMNDQDVYFKRAIKRYIFGKVKIHFTHIEEDSILANRTFHSNAIFHYTPTYLSNVANIDFFRPSIKSDSFNILLGNSTSPNNNHLRLLDRLKDSKINFSKIYCPLSYGNFDDYKNEVINYGNNLFGKKFIPLLDFMPIDQYMELLKGIDIALFDHERQEGMGITIQLISLGKIVFMNSNTTSYKSFKRRGFQVFDVANLNNHVFKELSVMDNKEQLMNYYCRNIFYKSILNLNY